jgi:hypothetical protein
MPTIKERVLRRLVPPAETNLTEAQDRLAQLESATEALAADAMRAMVAGEQGAVDVYRQHLKDVDTARATVADAERRLASEAEANRIAGYKSLIGNLQQRLNAIRAARKEMPMQMRVLRDAFKRVDHHTSAAPQALRMSGDTDQGFPMAANDLGRLLAADIEAMIGIGTPGQPTDQFADALDAVDRWLVDKIAAVKRRIPGEQDIVAGELPIDPEPEQPVPPAPVTRELKGIYAEHAQATGTLDTEY